MKPSFSLKRIGIWTGAFEPHPARKAQATVAELEELGCGATKLGLSGAVDFRSFRTMHSSLMLREGARPEVVRDNMFGDLVTRAVEAVSAATENAEQAEAKKDQPESVSNEWVPLWVPQQESKIASC